VNGLAGAASARRAAGSGQEAPHGSWALRSYLELGALPTAVPCARAHARLVAGEWGLAGLADTAELVVSELVTNGVKASAGLAWSWYEGRRVPGRPPVRLWLESDGRRLLIRVWDGSESLPQRPAPDLEGTGGRGLLLVEALAADWGTCPADGASGKVVWAVCAP
jgi:anti-sigma regulatory factor (Ser/Thr protein kinase)